MGLDMYLHARSFLPGPPDSHAKGVEAAKIQALFPELDGMKDEFDESIVRSVEIQVGYWRKANHIHRWFVENCQGGKDDCHDHYVRHEQIGQLYRLCKQALSTRDASLLPRQAGFFFGGIAIDDSYWKDVEHTIEVCARALTLPTRWSFMYQSSW